MVKIVAKRPEYRKRASDYASTTSDGGWRWTYTFMLLGLFVCIFTLGFVGHVTLVSKAFLMRLVMLCSLVGLLIPYRIYMGWLGMMKLEAILFNVLGVGPMLCAILVWINFVFTGESYLEQHRIVSTELEVEEFPSLNSIIYELEGAAYADFLELRMMEFEDKKQLTLQVMCYEFADGVLGYKVLKERVLK